MDLAGPESAPAEVRFRFLFFRLFSIYLSIAEIDTEATPPRVTLHYDIESPYFTPLEPSGDIPIPFGQAGLRFRIFRRLFFWPPGNEVDGRIVLAPRWSAYRFDFNKPDVRGRWDGVATRDDNQVDLTIAYGGYTFAEVDLTFGYTPAFITKLNYGIEVTPDPVNFPDNKTALDGSIGLPNGSYHFWHNAVD